MPALNFTFASMLESLYSELRRVAARKLRRQGRDHTLQPSAVVHEAYLRLAGSDPVTYGDRPRFLAMAARAMHEVLVDYARRRAARKRGGGQRRVTLVESIAGDERDAIDMLALDEALEALASEHERPTKIVKLRFFGGLTEEEVAAELDVSRTTVQGEWRFARAWLHQRLAPRDTGAANNS